ncbi:hypothetical protein AKJ09_02249 [Labilithrix luteola]|uniref:Uncharacterized protein n=1 Tax=Labilithrix luteola TaxID=1391654 RepID=A0A0K1PPW9_9BACT|nr:hypothetical protein [Labilithrix luteola]AKU95585.1 hypothetical protein AKJ09_02249 [Labilithrix luteola]
MPQLPQRTKDDAIGTVYRAQTPAKHHLYVKKNEDGWLYFGGKGVEDCLAEYANSPGKGGLFNDHLIANSISISPK